MVYNTSYIGGKDDTFDLSACFILVIKNVTLRMIKKADHCNFSS